MAGTSTHTPTKDIPLATAITVIGFTFISLIVDGYDIVLLSYALTSLKAEFGLTSFQAGSLGSLTLVGMVIGGLYGGWAADHYGRVRTVAISIVIFSSTTAVLGFSSSYIEFALIRFVSAMGIGSLYMTSNTLVSEYVPTKYRSTVLGTLQIGWTLGYLLAALMAGWLLPLYGWRWLFYIAGTPVVLGLLMLWLVPESPAWLTERARKADRPAEARARFRLPASWRSLLADPHSRRYFILWSIAAGLLQAGLYGVSNWMPSYLETELKMNFKTMTGYMVGSYLAMIFGKILSGAAGDYFGRRAVFAFGAISTAICLPVIVYSAAPSNIAYLLIFFGFLYGIPFGVFGTYMTETFETSIRGTACGGAYNVGRIGAAGAPMLIGMLATEGSIGLGFLVMGGAYFLAGVVPGLFIKNRLYDPQNRVASPELPDVGAPETRPMARQ